VAEARVTGPGVTEMQLLAARLKGANPALRRNLARQLRAEAGPAAQAAQLAVRTAPARHRPGRGMPHPTALRDEIAATVSVSVSTARTVTVTITSTAAKMPPGKDTLPKHFDSSRGWAHPVFGRGDRFRLAPSHAARYRGLPEEQRPLVKRGNWRWVRQMGRPQWFEQPIADHAPEFRRAAEQAIADTVRELGG
jgi:hypothetical protein